MLFSGWEYWIHMANFGTFTGRVDFVLPARFEGIDENANLPAEDDFRGKIVMLSISGTRIAAYVSTSFRRSRRHMKDGKRTPS
jgi:hypothetical protein